MNDQFKITASGRNFQQAVKLLKKRGGTFDGEKKTWSVVAGKIDTEDMKLWGLAKVAAVSAEAEMYRDWSENPNSNY
jgi:hypothetical protein